MDRESYKVGKKFKFGNNLILLPKQKYIRVDDMINQLSSENRYLFHSDNKHIDKIMAYVSSELDLPYSPKHIRTQLKLYAEEHYDDLKVFCQKISTAPPYRPTSIYQYQITTT